MARDRMEKFHEFFVKKTLIGILLLLASVLPLFIGMIFSATDMTIAISLAVLLVFVSVAIYILVRVNIIMNSLKAVLEEEDFTRKNKEVKKRMDPFVAAYWIFITAIFLAYSFITNKWDRSWIIWPVAGVSFAIYFLSLKFFFENNLKEK